MGMSPFSLSFGGPLDEEDIDALVTFIRAWEANPPVELPPEIERAPLLGSATEIFGEFCAQCHGPAGEGGIGPSFQDPAFQRGLSDEEMFDAIDVGHAATAMIAWGEVLSPAQIADLVEFIRALEVSDTPPTTGAPPSADVSFADDILPLFERECAVCHGIFGGWSADDYEDVMTSGDNAPVVIAGDPEASLLLQLMRATDRSVMPPSGALSPADIQLVTDWIRAGALDN
jgi:mono/diheme cytochrome c family protein